MAMYLLPTRGKAGYRGKRPNAIRSVSGGPHSVDRDGNVCVHFETNCGERFTVTRDRLELPSYAGLLCKQLTKVVKNGTVVQTMTQEQYDVWLAQVQQARELRALKRSEDNGNDN